MSAAHPAAILLAALAGGLAALAAREALLATPGAARWLRGAVEPVLLAGREGRDPTPAERRRLALVATAALLFGGALLLGPAPAAPLAAAGPASASWMLAARARRYRRAVERELSRIATATADALAAGRSVRAALEAAGASLEGPARAELARVRADLHLGLPTESALVGLRRRVASPRVDAFAAAVLSQRIAGGDLVALLRRFAAAAEARERAVRDARSATAQARFTGALVAAMPAGAALLAELLAPGFVAGMLASGPALALLAIAALLQVAGFAAIRRFAGVGVR